MTTTYHNLLVELFTEELPPKALQKLGEAFASQLAEQLHTQGLTASHTQVTPFASPRRLAAHISHVATQAADKPQRVKLMPVSVGLDGAGNATPALLKKLQTLGADANAVPTLARLTEGKTESLFLDSVVRGATLQAGLQKALTEAVARLPIPKVMTYQLHQGTALPGWDSVQFVRPAHSLVALHGSEVVPVTVLGLQAGRRTQGHRFEATQPQIELAHADDYARALREQGAVIASFTERRADIARQLHEAAARVGGGVQPVQDDALLDEVTALVERPNVLVCAFDEEFLAVPQECLILTMKANQKYFPLLDAQGRLTHRFLVVSNISPTDTAAIQQGNERVVRPRLADAKFFFYQDRKKHLQSRVPLLDKVVYHNQLGTQGARTQRVQAIAAAIATALGADVAAVRQAALLAKTDLLTDMVGEFPELQGIMGRYYAQADGLPPEVADAIEDHYKPRFAGDALPRGSAGTVLALADKLETLVGMFGIGNLPTGDKDPFALRRHALGIIRMLVEKDLPLSLPALLDAAWPAFGNLLSAPEARTQLQTFFYERLAVNLREQGYTAQEVDAVLALRPPQLADVARRLQAVRTFAALPEAPALAAANKRVGNILKKADTPTAADMAAPVQPALLTEPAEKDLYATLQAIDPQARQQWQAGDYATSLQTLAALRAPVDAFFEHVMVNAQDPALKANRLALLATLHQAMNRVADLSRLATG